MQSNLTKWRALNSKEPLQSLIVSIDGMTFKYRGKGILQYFH